MILTIILIVILYTLEAFHDYYIILGSNGVDEYSKKWHSFDFAFHILLSVLISYLAGNWLFVPLIALVRWTVFQNTLNVLRKKDFFYLGSKGVDGKLTKILGKQAGKILFISCVLGILFISYLILR